MHHKNHGQTISLHDNKVFNMKTHVGIEILELSPQKNIAFIYD